MSDQSQTKLKSDPGWSAWETIIIMGASMLFSALPYWFYASARGQGADILSYCIQAGCFFLGPVIGATVLQRKTPAELGLFKPPLPGCLAVGVLWGVLLYGVNVLISMGQYLLFPGGGGYQDNITHMLAQATPFETCFLLLLTLVMSPVAEETLFRGYFFPALQYRYGRAAAYIICAAVFTASHLSLWTLLPMVVASLGFCRLYEKYGCLWYNIVAHMAWNATALVIYFIGTAGL